MPKITRLGGVSYVDDVPADETGEGDQSSPGSSSETSSEKPQMSAEQNAKPVPSPARPTGSRSKRARTA